MLARDFLCVRFGRGVGLSDRGFIWQGCRCCSCVLNGLMTPYSGSLVHRSRVLGPVSAGSTSSQFHVTGALRFMHLDSEPCALKPMPSYPKPQGHPAQDRRDGSPVRGFASLDRLSAAKLGI